MSVKLDDGYKFCKYCPDIRAGNYKTFPLEVIAEKGCTFCKLILECIEVYQNDNREDEEEEEAYTDVSGMHGNILWVSDGRVLSPDIGIYVPENSPSIMLADLLGIARNPDGNSEILARLAYIRSVFRECMEEHDECRNEVGILPKRLLKISNSKVVLVDDFDGAARLRIHYACLSYCWGKDRPLMLQKDRIDEFRSGIAAELMPRTYQDAFRVIQALGIDYIWVDALCIVQDDRNDWAEEAPRMGDIYSSAVLTIAASRAKGSHEGFLFDHAKDWKKHSRIRCIDARGQEADVFVQPMEGRPMVAAGLAPYASSLWDTRGWTLQEAVFSRRLLSFEEREFRWRCRDRSRREFNPDDGGLYDYEHISALMLRQPDVAVLSGAWESFIGQYLERCFSHESDRLVAISGFARQLLLVLNSSGGDDGAASAAARCEYHAGHLLAATPPGGALGLGSLLWYALRPKTHEKGVRMLRVAPYRAPTWSWASVVALRKFSAGSAGRRGGSIGATSTATTGQERPIRFSNIYGNDSLTYRTKENWLKGIFTPSADILKVWTKSTAPYGTGEVRAGELTLGAKCFRSRLVWRDGEDGKKGVGGGGGGKGGEKRGGETTLNPSIDLPFIGPRKINVTSYSQGQSRLEIILDHDGIDLVKGVDVLCLRMGSVDSYYQYWLICRRVPALQESDEPRYERIGLAVHSAWLLGDIDALGKELLGEFYKEVTIV